MAELKRLAADVDEEFHRDIKTWCAKEGVTIENMIIAFFKALLSGDPSARKIADKAKKE